MKPRWFEYGPDKAFWLFAVFGALVFALGGGSRFDIESTGPLRAIAAIFLAIGLWLMTTERFSRYSLAVYLLLALALWMALQSVPLPPDIWSSLPGREPIMQAGALIGLEDNWRPITLSPQRTLNSLASLIVPLAALIWLALLPDRRWNDVRKMVVLVGVISAITGFAQLLMGPSSGLYFYEITNSDSAVGLFSNRNHNGLLLNIALLFSLFVTTEYQEAGRAKRRGKGKTAAPFWTDKTLILLIVARAILVLGILVNASRFGLLALAIIGLFYIARSVFRMIGKGGFSKLSSTQLAGGLVVGAGSALVLAIFLMADRIPGIERAFRLSLSEDQRAVTLPIVIDMVREQLPFGVGFGAFEQAFRMVEPAEILRPRYLNHAHNDWLQVIIEGGLPGVLILLAAIAALVRCLLVIWSNRKEQRGAVNSAMLGGLALLLMAAHSVVDYPLRTPSLMLLAMICVGLILRAYAQCRNGRLRSAE